ncbi:TRAP transporter small permease [Mariluticola halotolerans]|uniref:TRAP transporter small permease n=1 Tax=Mariluticola halotolerans TaxID=2909283 RepID=UPI0026E1DC99|nr:TRAP transporter small permease [Mariluticola halotolerans]UJQ94757.1 TRAP transporter small permease [Mariluticola halotolerans]
MECALMVIPSPNPKERPTERIILLVERVAAIMLGLVTLLIFFSAIGRYLLARPVPDAFDISRLTLAVAVIWGFASIGFRGSHIKVDLLTEALPRQLQRWTNAFAWLVLLIFTAALAWKVGGRALSQLYGGELTMDLRIPHWPFLAAIVLGLIMALVTTVIRLWRVVVHAEGLESHEVQGNKE